MDRNRHVKMLFVLGCIGLISACGDDTKNDSSVQVFCSDGNVENISGERVCIFEGPITETRFRCPPEASFAHDFGTVTMCTAGAEPPAGAFEYLEDRGYEPSLNNGNNPNNSTGTTPSGTTGSSTTSTGGTTTGGGTTGGVEPECADGSEGICECPFGEFPLNGNDTWVCIDEERVGCECGVVEDPFGEACTVEKSIRVEDLNRENTELFEEACLEERLINGCLVTRIERTYDRADGNGGAIVRAKVLEDKTTPNRPAYEQTVEWLFLSEDAYTHEFDYRWDGPGREENTTFTTTVTRDENRDGVVDLVTTTNVDQEDRVLRSQTQHDQFGYDTNEVYTYDDEGRISTRTYRFDDRDDPNNSRQSTTTFTYTEDGRPLSSETETEYDDPDKPLEVIYYDRWTYNEVGDPEERDQLTGGLRTRTVWNYDEDGQATGQTIYEYDFDPGFLRELIRVTFDDQGREIERITDSGGNGFALQRFTKEYDEDGNVIREVWSDVESGQNRSIFTWTYTDGRLVEVQSRSILENQGGQEDVRITTYNAAEQITEQVFNRVDRNGNVLEERERSVYTRREGDGLPTRVDMFRRGEPSGQIVYTYDAAGNVLEEDHSNDPDNGSPLHILRSFECHTQQ